MALDAPGAEHDLVVLELVVRPTQHRGTQPGRPLPPHTGAALGELKPMGGEVRGHGASGGRDAAGVSGYAYIIDKHGLFARRRLHPCLGANAPPWPGVGTTLKHRMSVRWTFTLRQVVISHHSAGRTSGLSGVNRRPPEFPLEPAISQRRN